MKSNTGLLVLAISAAVSGGAIAAVSADEARQLGTTLTSHGAEKAGNKEGTIPEYTGQPIKMPAGYNPKDPGQHPDPFNEKPLFSITAQNYTKYLDKLDGSAEMFKRFPQYRMDIYPSHRNFVYPKWVLDNAAKNLTSCKTSADELKLEGCYPGVPFLIPKTGAQVMWNHLTQFEARFYEGTSDNTVIPPNGAPVLQGLVYTIQSVPFYDPARTTPQPSNVIFWRVRTNNIEPARTAGGKIVLLDALDATRRAYQYIPGQRRVKLAPDLAFDTPSPYGGGAYNIDDSKGFLGSLERFDWKLVGKKEKFIPYDNFALMDNKTCPAEKLHATKNFINPDCVRWELHRVWVVQGDLKSGFRHNYKKRMMFWDEDLFGGGVVENYDAGGSLYRVVNSISHPFYETPGGTGGFASGAFVTDLQTGIAATSGMGVCKVNGYSCGWSAGPDHGDIFYSPEGMAGEGIR